MTEKHPCAGLVPDTWGSYNCSRSGKYHEDGKWWCGTHAPSKVAERRAKKNQADREVREAYHLSMEHGTSLIERLEDYRQHGDRRLWVTKTINLPFRAPETHIAVPFEMVERILEELDARHIEDERQGKVTWES